MTEPNQQRIEGGFGKADPKTGRPKTRRVSQRKELAVVTLGAVAAIAGVGGLLAASPPSGIASETVSAGNETTVVQPDPSSSGKASETVEAESEPSSGAESARGDDGGAPEREGPGAQVAPQPVVEGSAPAPTWSAPSPQQDPATAMSRGS